MDLSSEWVMFHRMAILSGVEPVWIDCCIESCAAFAGGYADLTECPFCDSPRFSPSGKPRRMFCYLPIIPRLQGFFQNQKSIDRLLYRANYEHIPGTTSDVFDGEHYRTLCQQNVVLDSKVLPHKYFSGRYDICLGICLDSYLLFKRNRGGPSATPILVKNYCIKPEVRTHLNPLNGGLMSAGLIPGPHPPKDARSFLVPYDDECAALAEFFTLRGYTLFEMGDIIAIENFCPCRSCEIKGVRNVTGRKKLYYNLPLRTPERLEAAIQKFDEISAAIPDQATAAKAKNVLAKFHGMKGLPALRRVGSLHYPRSRPWDTMHLFFENVVPNLFKGLDIPADTWDLIWEETAAAVEHIPSDFAWAFWFIYLAPILLKGRFPDTKYHTHLCELSDIIKAFQVETLRQDIIRWVRKYEEFYYQNSEARLAVCTLTVHGLVHVPDDILFCGPSWTTWTFFMERYCGLLQASLRSMRHPWANLNNNILRVAYLEQLNARYDVESELSRPTTSAATKQEYTYDSCKLQSLIHSIHL
ncbi:hypothetical protein DFH08DRAFT_915623 [Mycena albidolilacea]|uniref:Uncharacterized protein n=1 Tax=Mycena albidolilacea TaxID=1033008 RepID=A0AAD7ENE1_9AGAR|nr:hypothetical protein DFH08DRAFT_915623 [Mycena albidolilacea]